MALVGVEMALSELEMALAGVGMSLSGVVYPQQGKEGESMRRMVRRTRCGLCLAPPG